MRRCYGLSGMQILNTINDNKMAHQFHALINGWPVRMYAMHVDRHQQLIHGFRKLNRKFYSSIDCFFLFLLRENSFNTNILMLWIRVSLRAFQFDCPAHSTHTSEKCRRPICRFSILIAHRKLAQTNMRSNVTRSGSVRCELPKMQNARWSLADTFCGTVIAMWHQTGHRFLLASGMAFLWLNRQDTGPRKSEWKLCVRVCGGQVPARSRAFALQAHKRITTMWRVNALLALVLQCVCTRWARVPQRSALSVK